MTYENDPNRANRPRFRYDSDSGAWGLIVIALVVAGALAIVFMLLPASEDSSSSRVTENAPRTERPAAPPKPATPPANKPAPTTPPANNPPPAAPQK
jgi:hypothetical protein